MESCLGSTSNLSDGDRQIVQQAIGVLSRVVGSHDEAAAAGSSGTSSNTAIPTEDPDPDPVGDQERPSTSRGTSGRPAHSLTSLATNLVLVIVVNSFLLIQCGQGLALLIGMLFQA